MSKGKSQFEAIFKPATSEPAETAEAAVLTLEPEPQERQAKPILPGKSRNPDYTQTTVYLRKNVYRQVKVALSLMEGKQEFSGLVEKLLEQWLATEAKSLKL